MNTCQQHPIIIEIIIATPPNLDVPDESPCLISGSLPRLEFENTAKRMNAASPFIPVKKIVSNNTNTIVELYPSFKDFTFIDY